MNNLSPHCNNFEPKTNNWLLNTRLKIDANSISIFIYRKFYKAQINSHYGWADSGHSDTDYP